MKIKQSKISTLEEAIGGLFHTSCDQMSILSEFTSL